MYECADFTKAEVERYGRQIICNYFGIKGQRCLRQSKLLIVGCGSLGLSAGMYLAAEGIGQLGLVDYDIVEKCKLRRLNPHGELCIDNLKVNSMKQTLHILNPNIKVVAYNTQLTSVNAMDIFKGYDIVIDCTNNVQTRHLINDCAVLLKIPIINSVICGTYGEMSVYNYNGGPCYRCLYPRPTHASSSNSCVTESNIFRGIFGVQQATEAIKVLSNTGTSFSGKLFTYDAKENKMNLTPIIKQCDVCCDNSTVTELIDYEAFCGTSVINVCVQESVTKVEEYVVAEAQRCLRDSKILIVGCGGLGCPAGMYLAAEGVGQIGLVDHDTVEMSNLHRQIAHDESRIGIQKAESMKQTLNTINSNITVVTYNTQLSSANAMDIFRDYDIILDCTDNVPTRYLINDCAVLLNIPIVSASALGMYGQLSVYNHNGGPCYRCLYPRPPPASTVVNCNDGGVMGSVPGLLGIMQALEAIKILSKSGIPLSGKLFNYNGFDNEFNMFKLRPRMKNCNVCGDNPTITELIDYEEFCGMSATDACTHLALLKVDERVSVEDYNAVLINEEPHVLLDVRPEIEMQLCKFKHAIEVGMSSLVSGNADTVKRAIKLIREKICRSNHGPLKVIVLCRRGNDSQIVVQCLNKLLKDDNVIIKDLIGGMTAWARTIQPDLPVY